MSVKELIDYNNNNICNEDKNKNYNESIELQITGNERIVRSICFVPNQINIIKCKFKIKLCENMA